MFSECLVLHLLSFRTLTSNSLLEDAFLYSTKMPLFENCKSLVCLAIFNKGDYIIWYNIINLTFKVLWQLLEFAAYNTPVRCSWCSENRLRPQFHQSASSLLPQQSNSKDRRIISYHNKYHAKSRKKRSNYLRSLFFQKH